LLTVSVEHEAAFCFSVVVDSLFFILFFSQWHPLPKALELRFPKEFFPALGHALQRHLGESNASRAAGNSDW
jgi:hypothetical protein